MPKEGPKVTLPPDGEEVEGAQKIEFGFDRTGDILTEIHVCQETWSRTDEEKLFGLRGKPPVQKPMCGKIDDLPPARPGTMYGYYHLD